LKFVKSELIKPSLLFIIFLRVSVSAFAQQQEEEKAEDAVSVLVQEKEKIEAAAYIDAVFIIDKFDFNIKGMTKPYAIIRNGELKTGEIFNGYEALQKYIADKTQLLLNQRVLKTARIDYTVGEKQADGKYPLVLLISTEDTWNIIALPYPKYDSNTGFELILKARDYNFLGAMNPLRLDIGYKLDENNLSSLIVELESDTPFTAFGFNWNFTFNNYFNYRPQVSTDVFEHFFYQNTSGLSMELPVKRTTFTFGFTEYLKLNEENADRYKPDYGKFQTGVYMASVLSTSWKIPTGLLVGDYGELTYLPGISTTFNHEFPKWPLADFRRGPMMGFSHSLGFDKIDWLGNRRKGLSASFSNSYSYNFYQIDEDAKALSLSYSVSGKGHFIISDSFGVSTYLQFRHWFYHDPDYNDSAGDALRGIMDNAVHADYMLSLNLDFPVKILEFLPSKWFKTEKLRFFDFEMHVSPIIDMALYHDPESNIAFSFKNMLVSGGMEIIVFPGFMRSLYVRVSVAWNFIEQINNPREYYLNPVLPILPHLPEGRNREIFFGIGHHY